MTETPTTLEEARAAKAEALETFSALADVVGVGITSKGAAYCLKVNLRSLPDSTVKLPTQIAGVLVFVEVVGGLSKRSPHESQ